MNRKIIATLTTIPSRLFLLPLTVDTILKQTIKPDEIVISIPLKSTREPINKSDATKSDPYNITDEFLHYIKANNITILRPEKDYGPATKILGVLEREHERYDKENEPVIITFDDDKYYEPQCIQQLIDGHLKYPDCVIARKGSVLIKTKKKQNNPYPFKEILMSGNKVSSTYDLSIIFGTGGVLYRASFFESDVFDFTKTDNNFQSKLFFHVDDIYLSGYLAQKGILKKLAIFGDNDVTKKLDDYLKTNKSLIIDFDTRNKTINSLTAINSQRIGVMDSIKAVKYFEKYLVKGI